MSIHERGGEMMFDLFKAIYADDFDQAKSMLDLMRASGHYSDAIMRAKRKVHPLPLAPDLAKPIPLPQPGADPHTLFGGPSHRDYYGAQSSNTAKRRKRRKAT